jgi:hypothetical protein
LSILQPWRWENLEHSSTLKVRVGNILFPERANLEHSWALRVWVWNMFFHPESENFGHSEPWKRVLYWDLNMIGSLEFVILFQSSLITEQDSSTHLLIYCHSQLVELLGKITTIF